jgi:hypothetical protein
MKYRDVRELIQEHSARAGAVATFAVVLKLITPEQAAEAIRQFHASHPEIWGESDPDEATSPK